ncbi:uncharacterized protein [Littorina saxatilis]|uniref:Uncharacterized protein n=1 Tax=Littorina saxatilis TaxID=31220 RepID=A0AAN9ANY2_9CAEN
MDMTRAQREVSNVAIVGSFADDRSYAMMFKSDDHADADLPDKAPNSPSLPRLTSVHSIQSHSMGLGLSYAAPNPVAEELQHASDMSVENSTESHGTAVSGNSTVRVDITDIEEGSFNFTTSTLRKCKHQVLKPYWGLLMFIGWRTFRHDVIAPKSWRLRLLNFVYPVMIVLLLLYTYMYEMIACEWKLDIKKDLVIITSPRTTPSLNLTTTTPGDIPDSLIGTASTIKHTTPSPSSSTPQACEHIVTTYLIPNILHFIAYIMGLYFFRIQDNEQMYALMEKVFLQANPLQGSSQKKLIAKTRTFLAFGSVWVLMTLVLQGLYVWAYDFPRLGIFETYGPVFHWTTFTVELAGRVVFNSVLLAVVINYGTQCEMVMFYVKGLQLRLQEKSISIKTAFKDTLLLRQSLSLLNGIISKMTTLALVILAELTIIGVSILVLNDADVAKVWVYRSIFPVVWVVMLGFPLFQAARVNSVCLRIKKMSLEMRVFGYLNSSQLELDSFLQFVHFTRLKAKLFHIPILPSYVIAFSTLVAFIFLILVQTSMLGPKNYIV